MTQPPFTPDPQQPGPQQPGAQQPAPPAPGQPYGQPYAAPPPQPVEPEPKKSWFARHKVLTIIGASVIGIFLLNAIFGGLRGDSGADRAPVAETAAVQETEAAEEAPAEEAPAEEAPAEEPAAEVPGIGTPVMSGDLQFTVTSVEPGGTEIGDVLTTTAQGQFFFVHVEVHNTGSKAERFSDSNQKLVDDQGREHETDSTASLYMPGNDVLFTSINPGNTVVGTLVFDLPADATPVKVLLSSGGLLDKAAEVRIG